jgi:3,4-dihydroxy-2-butanone 4-phosphate synthase
MPLASTAEILADFKAGKMVILIDEEDRENEGDLFWRRTSSLRKRSTSWPVTRAA